MRVGGWDGRGIGVEVQILWYLKAGGGVAAATVWRVGGELHVVGLSFGLNQLPKTGAAQPLKTF
eukprot:767594-Hanusia_phi.AAC.16